MTRDWNIVRKILLAVEAMDAPNKVVVDGVDDKLVRDYAIVMYQGGLLRAEPKLSSGGGSIAHVHVFGLTWNGHELIDGIRKQEVFDAIVNALKTRDMGGATASLILEMSQAVARTMLGLTPPTH